jgi:TatD DNase family protein
VWDTHCHLADGRFDGDRSAVLARAAEAGVQAIVVVAADPAAWVATARVCGGAEAGPLPALHPAYGLHPHQAGLGGPKTWQALATQLRSPSAPAVALGEIGLDHHHGLSAPEDQRRAFERQLQLAEELDLPVILHEREAAEEVMDILRATGLPRRGGVWHCFSGGPDLAEQAVALGLHLGFGGLVTFSRGTEAVREAARVCPGERLLLETDAPYLAPVPHRGRRNEPAWVREVCAFLARLRGEDPEELARAARDNARRLFVPPRGAQAGRGT